MATNRRTKIIVFFIYNYIYVFCKIIIKLKHVFKKIRFGEILNKIFLFFDFYFAKNFIFVIKLNAQIIFIFG